MKPNPPFGSIEWALRAAGYMPPPAKGCPAERTGLHAFVLDLASGDTVPRCACGAELEADGVEVKSP